MRLRADGLRRIIMMKKRKYTFLGNLWFIIKGAWESAKSVLAYTALHIPVR